MIMFSLQSSASVSSHLHLVQEVAALRQKGCARLLHKVLQRLHHILTPGVVILPRFVIQNSIFFFNHMTPIKLEGEQRNRHKDVPLLNRGQNVLNQLLWPKKMNPITTDVWRARVHVVSVLIVVGRKNGVESQDWAYCGGNSGTYWE